MDSMKESKRESKRERKRKERKEKIREKEDYIIKLAFPSELAYYE